MNRAYKYFLLFAASLIFSFGFNVFLRPAAIAPGGLTGFAMLVNHIFPMLPVGILTLILNLPLFWFGIKFIGGNFVLKSVLSSVLISVFLDLHPLFPTINAEPLVAAIFGGVIIGCGMGLAFLAGGSTGGIDIAIRILRRKYPQLSIGQLLLVFDAAIVVASGIVYHNINNSLYAMVAMYAASITVDALLYGLNYAKCALIITDFADEINRKLYESLPRGTTLIPCVGGYRGERKNIILCAITRGQLSMLKDAVGTVDKNAFIIICEAAEVLGLGFKANNKNTF